MRPLTLHAFGNPPQARVACVLDVYHDNPLAFFVVKDSQNLYHEMKCLKNVLIEFLVFIANTDESVFRELVFRGRSGFRGLRFLKREFSRGKRIWI